MSISHKKELASDGFLTVREAEAFSGLCRTKLYALMADGSLPYAKVGGARRISKRALIELMARHMILQSK